MASDYTGKSQAPLTGGIVRSVPTTGLPKGSWLTALNVAFRDGRVVKSPGWTPREIVEDQREAGEVVSLIQPCRFNVGMEISLLATNKHFYTAQAGRLIRLTSTPFTCPAAEKWRADYILGSWYLTNPLDGLWKLEAMGIPTLVDTQGFKGRHVTQFRNHLVLSNLASEDTQSEHQWAGSGRADEAPPLGWDVTVEASDALLRDIVDDGDAILAARRWQDYLVHYKENSMHVTSFIGGDNVYQTDLRAAKGLMAMDAVSAWRDRHLFVGKDDLYAFAGGMPEGFGDRVWRWWIPQVAARGTMYCVPYPRQREWWVLYQESGREGISHALVWDYGHNAFSVRQLPFLHIGYVSSLVQPTYDELNVPMDSLNMPFVGSYDPQDYDLVGVGGDGQLYDIGERVYGAAGEVLESVLETGDIVAKNGAYLTCGGLIMDVPVLRAEGDAEPELLVYVSGRDSVDAPVVWRGPYSYKGGRFCKFVVSGYALRYKFVHRQLGEFEFSGYTPMIQGRE